MAAPDVLEADVLEADVGAGMVEADQEVLLQAAVQVILDPDLLEESQESKQALVERYKAHREALEQAIEHSKKMSASKSSGGGKARNNSMCQMLPTSKETKRQRLVV
jgi:hypothetical protein